MFSLILSPTFALDLTRRLIAIALVLQTIELISLHKLFSASGVWAWQTIKQDFNMYSRPLKKCLELTLGNRGFKLILCLQLICSVLLLVQSHSILLLVVLITTTLISVRFRGTFNGGSDSMTLVVVSAAFVASLWPAATSSALWYIGIQTGLSYFVAGNVKLKEPRWRNGETLRALLTFANYSLPQRVKVWIRSARKSQLQAASWLAISFECFFPIVFISQTFCLAYLMAGLVFHLSNVYILGLNRFLFAWLATYPAIFYLASLTWSN
jgi:hypothetical protein